MKDRPATRPARTSTSSTGTAGSRPTRYPTCRPTGLTPSASKPKGATVVRSKSPVQAAQAALEIRLPLWVRYRRQHEQPQGIAHDPASRIQVSALVLE